MARIYTEAGPFDTGSFLELPANLFTASNGAAYSIGSNVAEVVVTSYVAFLGTDYNSLIPTPYTQIPSNIITSPYQQPYLGSSPNWLLYPSGVDPTTSGEYPGLVVQTVSSQTNAFVMLNNIKQATTDRYVLSSTRLFSSQQYTGKFLMIAQVPDGFPNSGTTFLTVVFRKSNGEIILQGLTTIENGVGALNVFLEWMGRPLPPIEPEGSGNNPPISENTSGGGDGTFDNESDPITSNPISQLAGGNVIGSGFMSAYVPTPDQLKEIRDWLWQPNVFELLLKLVPGQDPMQYVIGMHTLPLISSQIPRKQGTFQFGGNWSATVFPPTVDVATTRFISVALGSVDLTEYSKTFADYSPYTSYMIYLPYVGMHELATDIIAGKSLGVTYRIDIVTGSCCSFITDQSSGNILYSFAGNMASNLPITNNQFAAFASAIATLAVGVGGVAISNAMSYHSAMKHASNLDMVHQLYREQNVPFSYNSSTGKWEHSGNYERSNWRDFKSQYPPDYSGLAAAVQRGAVATHMLSKRSTGGNSSLGGALGMVSPQTAYLIRTRPRDSYPDLYQSIKGYPSNVSGEIGQFTGYNVFDSFHLEGIPALPDELTAISQFLKGGIIL